MTAEPNLHHGRRYFDQMYEADPDPWGFDTSFYERRKYDLTMAALPRQHYEWAVEAGCANGALTRLLAPRCDELIAFDFVEDAVDRARQRLAGAAHVTVRCAEFSLWWPSGSGDLVVWSEVVYYLNESGFARAAAGLDRWLRPGGHLLAVHYTGVTDYPLGGAEAHRLIDGLGFLHSRFVAVDTRFVAQLWRRS